MQNLKPFLTLFRFQSRGAKPWIEAIIEGIRRLEYEAVRSKGIVKTWKHSERTAFDHGLSLSPGFEIGQMERNFCLVVLPTMFLFEPGSDQPSAQSTSTLLASGLHPQLTAKEQRIRSVLEFTKALASVVPGLQPEPIAPSHVYSNLHQKTNYIVGGGNVGSCGENLPRLLKKHGFLQTPQPFRITVFSPDAASHTCQPFIQQLESRIKELHAEPAIFEFSYQEIQQYLTAFEDRGLQPKPGRVALIGVTGQTGAPLSEAAAALLKRLDTQQIPYRLFSLENPAMSWSAFDMAGILVQLAGGVPYRLRLPWPDRLKHPVLIGLDLGHPRNLNESVAVITIVDSNGVLLGYWRGRQPRDETLREQTLREGLTWAKQFLQSHYPGGCEPVIMRDGRRFRGETFEPYEELLGPGFTYIEVVKSPAPFFCLGYDNVPAGTACRLEGIDGRFLVANYPVVREQLLHPIRIRLVRDDWALGEDAVTAIVAGLCYAPKLGLAPSRLPAPTYWADGIAAIGPTDHRFSGLHWVATNSE